MHRRHRLRTLSVALPLWIVMILTGGQWCLMPQGVAHPVVAATSGVGHAAEGAHGDHAPQRAHGDHARAGEHSQQDGHGEHSRDGASCESQAPCSVAIAAARLQLAESDRAGALDTPSYAPGRPHSLALAPELPPPRA